MKSPIRCLVVDDDEMSRTVLEHFVGQHDALTLVGSCESAIEAVNVLRTETIDLAFLDVEMPMMSGLDLVKSLDQRPQIILVTAKQDYAIEAFDVEVTDYILKPLTYARFLKSVQRAQRNLEPAPAEAASEEPEYVFIKAEGRLVKLQLDAVRWIEAQGDYVMIHTQDQKYMVHSTMKGMQNKLPSSAFARVHRSYIVRLDQIADIEDTTLVIGRQVIPIGASYRKKLLAQLNTL